MVRDSSGAPVPGAKVSLLHKHRNAAKSAFTASDGSFTFSVQRVGLTGRFQYALARTYFYGPQHFRSDLAAGIALWNDEPRRLDLEFDVTNGSNSI